LKLRLRAIEARNFSLRLEGGPVGAAALDGTVQTVEFTGFAIPPGRSVLTFHTDRPALLPGPGDPRLLDVALYGFELQAIATR